MNPIQTSRQGDSTSVRRANLTHGTINDFAHHSLSVGSKRETETTCTLFLSKKQSRNRVLQISHRCSLLHHHQRTKRLQGSPLSSTIPAPPQLPTTHVHCASCHRCQHTQFRYVPSAKRSRNCIRDRSALFTTSWYFFDFLFTSQDVIQLRRC